jgi:hypothetical protein
MDDGDDRACLELDEDPFFVFVPRYDHGGFIVRDGRLLAVDDKRQVAEDAAGTLAAPRADQHDQSDPGVARHPANVPWEAMDRRLALVAGLMALMGSPAAAFAQA